MFLGGAEEGTVTQGTEMTDGLEVLSTPFVPDDFPERMHTCMGAHIPV